MEKYLYTRISGRKICKTNKYHNTLKAMQNFLVSHSITCQKEGQGNSDIDHCESDKTSSQREHLDFFLCITIPY